MRKRIFTLGFLLTLAVLPGFAAQAQTLQLAGNADCQGWSTTATLNFPDDVFFAALDYSVVLADGDGSELDRFDWSGMVDRMEDPAIIMMFGESWNLTLDSTCTASLVFHFLGEEASLAFDVVCGAEEPAVEPCRHTFRYWRKHPEEWPVQELLIGGEIRSQAELLDMMHRHLRFHPAFSVARHLIATRLNVLSGTDDSIMPVIEEAETFLVDNMENRHGWWRNRSQARELRHALVRYNRLPCDSGNSPGDLRGILPDKDFDDEAITFDGLKAIYR